MSKVLYITPCCNSVHCHPVNSTDIPTGVWRCELCDKLMDFEVLIRVEKRINPLMFYCDSCFETLEQQRQEDK